MAGYIARKVWRAITLMLGVGGVAYLLVQMTPEPPPPLGCLPPFHVIP